MAKDDAADRAGSSPDAGKPAFQPRDPAAPPPRHPGQKSGPPAGDGSRSPGSTAILGVLLLVAAFVIWKQFFSAPEAPAAATKAGAAGKAGKAGKGKPERKTPPEKPAKAARKGKQGNTKDTQAAAGTARAADSAAPPGPVARWSVREEVSGGEPEDPEAYAFARVPWEDPASRALEQRVRRSAEGFDRRPVGRFALVEGGQAFLRLSVPVYHARDRKLSRIPETAVSEYLPEWYQRGFTLHFRGHREPFAPRTFRLRAPPGSVPPPDDGGDHLVNYAVYADVGAPEALLIYPDAGRGRGEGANAFTDAGELRTAPPEGPFGADYFRRLTGARIDSVRAYALADRGLSVVEAFVRRRAYLFLVRPADGRIAFLVHGLDPRPCRRDKDIRFLGLLDVDGDETPELLLGPHPAFLVHEDAEGIKYHYAAGSFCGS